MRSETIRNSQTDQLLTPENSAFVIIDYQPIQVSSIRSMPRNELVFDIVSIAKARVQRYCERQRDWSREETVPGFMGVFDSFDGFNVEKAAEEVAKR